MHKCRWLPGLAVKPDGIHELDPCVYEEIAVYRNVTVTVSRCRRCGHMDISWVRQEDTEELEPEGAGTEQKN